MVVNQQPECITMATNKPRAPITFPPNLYNTLHRFAELQGVSLSAVIVGILDGVHMPLMRTVALFEAAQSAPREVVEGLKSSLESMELEIVKQSGAQLAQLDFLADKLGGGGGGVQPQGASPHHQSPKGAKKGANPRPSNTGVRSTNNPTKKKGITAKKKSQKTPRGSTVSKSGRA